MKTLILGISLIFSLFSFGQDSLLTYSKVIPLEGVSKDQIFDKALVWCSKSFSYSKAAIDVKERESGIIGGKGNMDVTYYIQRKKDSALGFAFSNYEFSWLIEVKENKARLTISEIKVVNGSAPYQSKYPVTTSNKSPVYGGFSSNEKWDMFYTASKKKFLADVDLISVSLRDHIVKKEEKW